MYPSASQIRAARAYLDMSQGALAEAAKVSERTIASMEAGRSANRSTIEWVMSALMARGITFPYDPETKRRGVEGPPDPKAP